MRRKRQTMQRTVGSRKHAFSPVAVSVAMVSIMIWSLASGSVARATPALLAAIPHSGTSAPGHAHGWPRVFFDARNDSYNRYEQTISPSNVGDLQLAWSVPLKGAGYVTAGPLVVGGAVYLGTHGGV